MKANAMKRLSLWICLVLALCITHGCATTRIATKAGARIGNSYQSSAALGTVTAEESIAAWPYISGLIKGVYSDNYELEVSLSAKNIISNLDLIAAKDVLTDEDKGVIIGHLCRLEAIAIKEGWSKYGITIFDVIGAAF